MVAAQGRVLIGTSGFSYKEWKPSFYPKDVSQKKFLEYYASQFGAVEIDYTFYRMPTAKTLDSWKASTGEAFRFALKASRRITHFERLRVPSEALDYLMDTLPNLEDRLGILLYQLPPNFKCDTQRLELFLAGLPPRMPCAFEFRHESWFSEEVYELLERYKVALCVHDADDHTTPIRLTAGRTYVRLRKSEYSDDERVRWQERFLGLAAEGIDVFAFIKHEGNPDAPAIAQAFAEGV